MSKEQTFNHTSSSSYINFRFWNVCSEQTNYWCREKDG